MAEKESAKFKLPYPTTAGEVKVGSTDIEELALKLDTVLGEKVLIIKKYSGSGTLASGELAIQEETGKTFTLPSAATANQYIAIFSKVAETKVTSASETFGPGFKAAAWKLTTGQGALLRSDGVNWLLLTSEYLHEGKYSAQASGTSGTPSATRDAMVTLEMPGLVNTGLIILVSVGGVHMGGITRAPTTGQSNREYMTFRVPAGQKWELTESVGITECKFSNLLL